MIFIACLYQTTNLRLEEVLFTDLQPPILKRHSSRCVVDKENLTENIGYHAESSLSYSGMSFFRGNLSWVLFTSTLNLKFLTLIFVWISDICWCRGECTGRAFWATLLNPESYMIWFPHQENANCAVMISHMYQHYHLDITYSSKNDDYMVVS